MMKPRAAISRDILVEELLDQLPDAVTYLMRKGIQVIACGAPIWGTLEEAARTAGYDDEEIDAMAADLAALLPRPDHC